MPQVDRPGHPGAAGRPGAASAADATQYAIDQFVMRGGTLMVMVDPHSEAEAATPRPDRRAADRHLLRPEQLFDAWGIASIPPRWCGDLRPAPGGCGPIPATGCRRSTTSPGSTSATASATTIRRPPTCTQVTVASSGLLTKKPDADDRFHPAAHQQPRSAGLIPARTRAECPIRPDPGRFQPRGRTARDRRPRAWHADIRLHRAAAAARRRQDSGPADFPPLRAADEGPANIVVVADTDILADRFWVRVQDFFGQQEATPFSDNGAFVANLVGTLAGGDALIGLRARGAAMRPFDRGREHAAAGGGAVPPDRTDPATASRRHPEAAAASCARATGAARSGDRQTVITPEQRAAIEAAGRRSSRPAASCAPCSSTSSATSSGWRSTLRVFNIVLVPALLTLVAIGLALLRRRRRCAARHEDAHA